MTHITFNRPDDGNGVTNEIAVELTQILAEAGQTSNPGAPEFRDQMNKLLRLQTKMADSRTNSATVRQHLRDYRVRMDELHAQIVTLKAVKTRGPLMRHLKQKLKEISSRVQRSTIKLVNLQEQDMKLRIRFQDGIAELTLDKKPSRATAKKTAKK